MDSYKHELKILPEYFNEVINGNKIFEIRKNDRNFKVGDTVLLREYNGSFYTGRFITVIITYIFKGGSYGLEEGYCIFSFSSPLTNTKE